MNRSSLILLIFVAACPSPAVTHSQAFPATRAPASLPSTQPTSQPASLAVVECRVEVVRNHFDNGEWRATEMSAQECLRAQPLATEVRLILVRLYLMRAYAAREPRWLDEARRQLHMAESDPVFTEESKMLLRLVDEPTVE